MARATTCIYENKKITIEMAIEIRAHAKAKNRKSLEFTCTSCGERVRPHKAGGNGSAHFEHLMRNPACELSDPER